VSRRLQGIRCLGIANRGEAAMRCLRSVKALRRREGSELRALVLYTKVERDAPFVRHADRAVELPCMAGREGEAYLDVDRVLSALREGGADAVWPGWGFLAEDAAFAEAVIEEGLLWLGPEPGTLRGLGDKISAKRLAEEVGVPVTPWSGEALADAEAAKVASKRLGYPVVLKAAAGGGGRGIRVVARSRQIEEAFRSASEEARAAFGDDRIFVESRVEGGRHVEVQIAADLHGHVHSLGLRDCSVQRRHQKVIEETPPPGLADALAQEIEDAAIRVARHAGYQGLGTVEFLVEGREYALLEVNPRLQVEHGLTETVTGLDLVELQVRIARGENLESLVVERRGAAMEARLCAEDPDAEFAPAPGRVARFDPALGPAVRVDSGFAAGSVIPGAFDSLVAKVIASGSSRVEALARLEAALADLEVVIEGGTTNKGFLLDVLATKEFRAGGVDTGWLDRYMARRPAASADAVAGLVAASILAYQRARRAVRFYFYADPSSVSPAQIPASAGQRVDLTTGGQSYRLHVFAVGSWRYRVHLDGRVATAVLREESDHAARMVLGGETYRILHDADESGLRLEIEGRAHRFGTHTAGEVRASSPAMVVALHVASGDRVKAGDSLGLLEAMKTEIAVRAPVAGCVREVRVVRGQQVRAGDVLLVVDPGEGGDSAGASSERTVLPRERDPLDVLVSEPRRRDGRIRARLKEADRAAPEAREAALAAARGEIRRVLLGYDVNEARGERLLAFVEEPLPDISEVFRGELADVRRETVAFADVERLFVRAARASSGGQEGPSNYARLQMYVRRLRASGAGIADDYLGLLKRALSHYGIESLEPSDALERAVLRLLATQRTAPLRRRLALGLVRRLAALARSGLDLSMDRELEGALSGIVAMRGLVSDALADAALDARYQIFQSPGIAREAERASKAVEEWLSAVQAGPAPLPRDVLREIASAPRAVFDRVGRDVDHSDPRRRAVALAAHLHRLYLPGVSLRRAGGGVGDTAVERVELDDGRVVLGVAVDASKFARALSTLDRMVSAEASVRAGGVVDQVEVFAGRARPAARKRLLGELERWLGATASIRRLTTTFASEDDDEPWYETFEREGDTPVRRENLQGVHPEVAQRIDLARLVHFELKRLPGGEDLYCFRGRHRENPEDERIFVLAEVRGLAPESEGREARLFVPAFENAFFEATRRLRTILGSLDPARRLQWNRLCLFVAPEVILDGETAGELARKLHPATRHLGLDKVVVRLRLLNSEIPEGLAEPVEIVISDPTGSQMELAWREPRDVPLQMASRVERRLAESRRRGLLYPYEILRLLTGDSNGSFAVRDGAPLPARGRFEEWDLEAQAEGAERSVCVAGRPLGRNVSSVVFGVLTTPTEKVPEGLRRVIVLSDPTLGMGSLGPAECDRLVAAIDLAEQLSIPVEWIPVSSGARIAMESGTENLDATARVVRRIVTFTQGGGSIHILVHGVNVGAQSYFDALATMLMHDRGALIMMPGGSMVLTGRAALEASGSVSGEDEAAIGGYEHVMGPNGEAQYFAHDFLDAYRILTDHYRYTYVVPGEACPRPLLSQDPPERDVTLEEYGEDDGLGYATIGEIFDAETNPGRKRPFSMRALMRALVDRDGGWLERWRSWVGAETSVVWDAHLGGHSVCLVGIESRNVTREGYRPSDGPDTWSAGTLFPQSSKKVARALNAASGNRPVVLLANLSGFDGSPESMRKLQLEYGAEIARAVVNFEGPILFLVVSRYHGGAYVVFSRALNAGLRASALDGSFASVIGGGPAAKVVFAREVRARAAADPRLEALREDLRAHPGREAREALERLEHEVMLEKQEELASEFDAVHTVERALRVGSLEEILPPRAMRPYLIGLLDAAD
jgi:acetyl/propionyl-CoA carboxylase alpha subunit/acetyl-CoA carboxylase carboxyltransferase component